MTGMPSEASHANPQYMPQVDVRLGVLSDSLAVLPIAQGDTIGDVSALA